MIKQLKRRLMLTYTVFTCLLLTVIVFSSFLMNKNQVINHNISSFETEFHNILDVVTKQRGVSDAWLSRQEAANRMLLRIYSNGVGLEFNGAWEPEDDRQRLFEKLAALAEQDGYQIMGPLYSGKAVSPVYSVTGERGERYYGRLCIWSYQNHPHAIYVLKQLGGEKAQIQKQLIWHILLNLLGCACLLLISRFLVEKTLRPVLQGLKRQNEFIAAASHELRSPLTVIRAGLHAIGEDPEKAGELLPGVDREGERMARLISDMLLLASSDAGNWTMHRETIQPETMLITAYDSLSRLCRTRKQKLTLSLPEQELRPLEGDPERLEQVLMILVDNASAYSPEGSGIAMEVMEGRRHLEIAVIDHGCGISAEDKKRIFDRFYRSDHSRKDKSHFGLGLSIAAELVRLHHGKITVRDTPGGGSVFLVELPILQV